MHLMWCELHKHITELFTCHEKEIFKFMVSDFIKKSLLLEGNFINFFLHVMRKKYLKFMLSDIEMLKLFGCIAKMCSS